MKNSVIYPEMNEKTNATIEYTCSYLNGFYVTTNEILKGRGIKLVGNGENHKRKMKTYIVTDNAMNKIKQNYNTCYIASL